MEIIMEAQVTMAEAAMEIIMAVQVTIIEAAMEITMAAQMAITVQLRARSRDHIMAMEEDLLKEI
jgi:hypothetical protein